MTEPHPSAVDPEAAKIAAHWATRVLVQGDLSSAWHLLDGDAQLALSQTWLLSVRRGQHPNREHVATTLALGKHPEFPRMLADLTQMLRHSAPPPPGGVYAVGTAGRPIGADLEGVALFDADDVPTGRFEPGASHRCLMMPVRFCGVQRKVAGVGWLIEPGWPPTFTKLDGSLHP